MVGQGQGASGMRRDSKGGSIRRGEAGERYLIVKRYVLMQKDGSLAIYLR